MPDSAGKTQPAREQSPESMQSGADGFDVARRWQFICSALVLVASLQLYRLTLAPTVTLVDSGELIVAAKTLGIAHPPGVPLYVLLAHLATFLPLGSVAARVNFASALFAALASATVTLLAAEVLAVVNRERAREPKTKGKKDKKKPVKPREAAPAVPGANSKVSLAVSTAIGLLFAFSRTLWSYGTITEVYTLNILLVAIVFLLFLKWRSLVDTGAGGEPSSARLDRADRWLIAAAFAFGLALCVHHVTVVLTLPALALTYYRTVRRKSGGKRRRLGGSESGAFGGTSRRLLFAAAATGIGLAFYLYLPLSASRKPLLNWGDPSNVQRIWWHLTGRQYQVFLAPSLEVMIRQTGEFFELTFREFGPWWVPVALLLAAIGVIKLFRSDRTLFYFIALVILFNLAYSLNYEIAEDKDAYYLPTFLALVLSTAVGAREAINYLAGRLPGLLPRRPALVAAAILLVVCGAAVWSNFRYNNRSHYLIASDYIDNITSTIGEGGMLLTQDWQVYSPFLYLREIEGNRRDITAIDVNLLRRSWYYDYLRLAYPWLMAAARDKVDAFMEDLKHWEQDPDLYQRDVALNQRITTRFNEMILGFVKAHMTKGSVYATWDMVVDIGGDNRDLTRALNAAYGTVPQGLVF
ncbi:MAG TPA: DUF2723 domain-containing protein, partial [Blastocatellia bacterium]|nr:DUF2723 domain-containing protein [Blastocatellia bacterium]